MFDRFRKRGNASFLEHTAKGLLLFRILARGEEDRARQARVRYYHDLSLVEVARNYYQLGAAFKLQELSYRAFYVCQSVSCRLRPLSVNRRPPVPYLLKINEIFTAQRQLDSALRFLYKLPHTVLKDRTEQRQRPSASAFANGIVRPQSCHYLFGFA